MSSRKKRKPLSLVLLQHGSDLVFSETAGVKSRIRLEHARRRIRRTVAGETPAFLAMALPLSRRRRSAISEQFSSGPTGARKAWLGAIIVETGKIRVVGETDTFEKAL